MAGTASFKGHPIHAMLVSIPIGLWIFALGADAAGAWFASTRWQAMAFYSIGAGLVGALLAAVPGLIDLVSLERGPAKRIGLWHMTVNLLAVGVFATNFYLRWQDPMNAGPLGLSILGVALIGMGGWLGGSMVYVHGVGVDTARRPDARAPWRA